MKQMFSLYFVQDDVTIRLVSGDERTLYVCTESGSRNPCLRVIRRVRDSYHQHTAYVCTHLPCSLCCPAVRSGSVGSDCALIDL